MKTRLPVLALVLAAAGCADNNASIQMVGACGLPASGCTFAAECDVFYGGEYEWDVANGDEMVLPIEVRNQVASNAGGVAVNTNGAKIYRTVTEYSFVGDAIVLDPNTGAPMQLAIPRSTAYVSENVDAGSTAVVFPKPFSSATTAYLNSLLATGDRFLVKASVHLEGEYDNGRSFRTGDLEIPIFLCSGCVPPPTLTCTSPDVPVTCPAAGQTPSTVTCPVAAGG